MPQRRDPQAVDVVDWASCTPPLSVAVLSGLSVGAVTGMVRNVNGYRGTVDVENGIASYNAPPNSKGEKPPEDGASELGRAPEGEVLVVFDVVATTTSGHFTEITHDVYNHLRNPRAGEWNLRISYDVPRNWGATTEMGRIVVSVPEWITGPLEFDYETISSEGDEYATVQGDLTPIATIADLEN